MTDARVGDREQHGGIGHGQQREDQPEHRAQPAVDRRISCQPVEIEGQAFIRLSVQDWGTGIPQGILEKLFEPFFTSKPAGQGSGLGLSISYGIIKNHHGRLRVDSMLNKFTEMIIEIPAADV